MMFHSFQRRLIVTFNLFVVLLLLIIACSTHAWFSYHTNKMLFREQFTNTSNLVHSLDDKILTAQRSLQAVATVIPKDKRNDTAAMQSWLANRTGIQTIFNHGLFVYDDNSKIIAAIPKYPDLIGNFHSHHPYLQETIANGVPYISKPFRSHIDATPVMAMTAPVFDEKGKLILVLAGQVKLQSKEGLFHDILRPAANHTGYFYLFGKNRTIYLHPDSYRMFQQGVPVGVNKAFDAAINGFEGTMETLNSKKTPFIVTVKRLQSVDLILAANFPVKEAYAPYYRFISVYLLGMLIAIMLGVAAAWLLGRRLSLSISNLSSEIFELSKDPDPQKRINGSDELELQLLSASFNNLLDKLATRETSIRYFSNELEKKNQELTVLLDKSREATKTKDVFLATMSHEIRTPLNGIIGMTSLLLETELDEEQKRYTGMVRKSGDNLLEIINDILDFSKIDAGHLELESITFDPRQVLEDVVELLSIRAAEKGLELTCYVEPTVPIGLKGDPYRLRQVLTNLTNNAIKFTEKGEVSITAVLHFATTDHLVLKITVQDTGIGIPENRLKSIFEPFTQADGSTTRKYGGSGLGLAICKQLVQFMGGEISVKSEVGVGSQFWFTASFDVAPDVIPIRPPSFKISPAPRVLVMDSKEICRKTLDMLLKESGCDFQLVENADKAFNALQEHSQAGKPFQIVLLDCSQAEAEALALLQKIRADEQLAGIILIALAYMGQHGLTNFYLNTGFDACMYKPVRQQDLYNCLTSLLNQGKTCNKTPLLATEESLHEKLTRARILLVEDNETNQAVALAMLAKAGYKADVAANGAIALEKLATQTYDLVLMDCQMPVMDGFEATKRLRISEGTMKNRAVPVIAMTANAMDGDREYCLSAGMDDYLPKPVKPAELKQILVKWLKKSAPVIDGDKKPEYDAKENPENLQIFNQPELLDRVSDSLDLMYEIIEIAMEDIPRQLQQLQAAAANNNKDKILKGVHTLKGCAANISATELHLITKTIEKVVSQDTKEPLKTLLQELEACCTRLMDTLKAAYAKKP